MSTLPIARTTPTSPSGTATAPKIRVLCVDDSRDITAALRMCIAHEPDMQSVGSLHTANNFRAELAKCRPDVVLLDLDMPGDDPLEVLRGLTGAARAASGEHASAGGHSAVRVIVFSGRSDQDTAESAAKAGAWGYIFKSAEIPVILEAIRKVARGNVAFGV